MKIMTWLHNRWIDQGRPLRGLRYWQLRAWIVLHRNTTIQVWQWRLARLVKQTKENNGRW